VQPLDSRVLALGLVLQIFWILTSLLYVQVIVADNLFTGSKDNLKKWIGHPRFEFIRHGK
jgi:hypothetical protein